MTVGRVRTRARVEHGHADAEALQLIGGAVVVREDPAAVHGAAAGIDARSTMPSGSLGAVATTLTTFGVLSGMAEEPPPARAGQAGPRARPPAAGSGLSGASSSSTIQPALCTSRAIVSANRMSVLSARPVAPL